MTRTSVGARHKAFLEKQHLLADSECSIKLLGLIKIFYLGVYFPFTLEDLQAHKTLSRLPIFSPLRTGRPQHRLHVIILSSTLLSSTLHQHTTPPFYSMAEATQSLPTCIRCGKLASLSCQGCKAEDPNGDLIGRTKYCSKLCQEADWPDHKATCKRIRAIREEFWSRALQELQNLEFPTSELPAHQPQDHGSPPNDVPPHQASSDGDHETYQGDQAPTQPNNSTHPCASCQSPATAACKACQRAPDAAGGTVPTTYYCSRTCQTAHQPEHAGSCLAAQARRHLYDAGEMLQKQYYVYCKGLVTTMLQSGSLNRNHMILHEENSVQCATNAIDLFRKMHPDSEEERACLASLVGSDFSREPGSLIKEQLKGTQRPNLFPDPLIPSHPTDIADRASLDLYTSIRQVTLSLKSHRRRFIREDWQVAKDKHRVLHVLLKNDEHYALDITGVQFGLTTPVVPWTQYFETHVAQVVSWDVFAGTE